MKDSFSRPQARPGTRRHMGVWHAVKVVNGCLAAAVLSACAVPSGSGPDPATAVPTPLPVGFVHLAARVPDVLQDMRYHVSGRATHLDVPGALMARNRC